jgi:hypothetical protein
VDACGSCSHCPQTTLPADVAGSGTSIFTFSIVMCRNYPRIAQITESPIGGTPGRRSQAVRDPVPLFVHSPMRRQRSRLASRRTPVDNPLRSQVEERDMVPPRSPLQVDRCLASLDELVDRAPGQHGRGRFGEPTDLHVVGTHDFRTSVLVPEQQQHPLRNAGLDGVVRSHDVIPRSRAQQREVWQSPDRRRRTTLPDDAAPTTEGSPIEGDASGTSFWGHWVKTRCDEDLDTAVDGLLDRRESVDGLLDRRGAVDGRLDSHRRHVKAPAPGMGQTQEPSGVRPQCRRKTNHRTGLGNQCDTTIIHRSPDEPRGLDS